MPKCQSWFPLAGATMNPPGNPGGKARKWKPCSNRVEHGQVRCTRCQRALLTSPNPSIRAALALEVGQPLEVLRILADDLDPQVAIAARRALSERGEG